MTVASLKELVCSQCGFTGPTDALPHRCPNCGADAAKLWVIDRATAAAPRRRQWGRGLALVIVLCLIPLATDDLDLSPRESEVLALICQGLTNADISERAFIGVNTVKAHIRTLYRKIGVESRSQAVRWGLEHGFAPDVSRRRPEE